MTENITLGGREFALRPLKLGQLRHVLDALDRMSGASGGGLIEAAAQVVAAGLAPACPELDLDRVLDLEATVEELNAAVSAVLRVAGLHRAGEARPVANMEAQAGGSASSTPLSPPAAAMPIPTSTR